MGCKSCQEVSASDLRERIVLEVKTETQDEVGGRVITWSTYVSAWAQITPKSASESFFARHLEHRVTHLVLIRYVTGVTASMRVKFGSRYFAIKGVKNIEEKNQLLELSCEEGAAP